MPFTGFLFIVRTVWPTYSRTRYAGIRYLLRHLMPIALMPLVALGLVAAILRRGKVEWGALGTLSRYGGRSLLILRTG